MVKKKQKKVVRQKQKQKQNVNVKQNVKVVVGDVKRKQVRKSSGTKSGASAKPPIVLNISNPQPYNNPYMMYFKEQLQNQEPIKANTLAQHEKISEREETKASKAGALHKLDREPNDVAREMKRQGEALQDRLRLAEVERKLQEDNMVKSFKKSPKETKSTPTVTRPQVNPPFYRMVENPQAQTPLTPQQEGEEELLKRELEEQKARLEREMENATGGGGDGAGAGGSEGDEEQTITITPKKRGRKKGSKNKPKTPKT
jgi:hypothetical protein